MTDINATFEAMMANVTAPPLSLDEFRVFVNRDSKAKNALAFCEWYQRYKEVYFDRTTIPSTRYTRAKGIHAGIPYAFEFSQQATRVAADRISVRSVSVPNLRINQQQLETATREVYTLKSHSFSLLSESMADSAFNTKSTGNSNSTSASRGQISFSLSARQSVPSDSSGSSDPSDTTESFRCAQATSSPCRDGHTSVYRFKDCEQLLMNGKDRSRRYTCSAVGSRYASRDEAQKQEEYRQQLQSLLIYECWIRFISCGSTEMPFVSDMEIMYIKECLPLGLTQMVQPLLCNSDMLDALPTSSMACGAPIERALPVSCNPSMFMAPNNHNQQISTSAASPLVSQRSLQFQPYEQLKRNLMTQIRIKRFNMLHKQIPEDLNFKDKHFCSLYLDSAKHNCCVGKANAESTPDIVETVTAKEFIAGLRRISTMPTLNHHSNAKAGLEQQSQRPSINQYSQLRQPLPTCLPSYRAKRLLSMREVQNIHYSLRPYPPQFGSAGIRDQQRLFQAFGYRPIPQTMTQLIAPSLVPPALFDTAAKLASDYLLQTQFSDFYRLAHYNITAREQRNVLAGSLVLLMLGLAVSAAMVLLKLSIAWRLFAVPMLLLALLLMTEVFTRVSVILWLTRRRSTALVFSKNMLTDYSNYNDTEKSMQSEQPSGTDIQAVQAITGTLRTSPMVGFAGTIHNTGFCSESRRCRFCIDSPYSGSHKRNTGLSSLPQTRTSSSLSLWSHPTIGSAVGSAFDRLVCFMLRKRNIGDQWHIDFHVQRYEVVERQVIRNQALIVFYQICVLLVLLTAALMALFLIA